MQRTKSDTKMLALEKKLDNLALNLDRFRLGSAFSSREFDLHGERRLSPRENTEIYRKTITRKIIDDIKTLEFLEQEEGLRLLKHQRPELETLTLDTIKSDCMDLFNKEREGVKQQLSSEKNGRICLRVDAWNSQRPGFEFVCISACFIFADGYGRFSKWELKEVVLKLRQLPSPLQEDDLTHAVLSCLSEWGIEERISAVIFKNGPVYDSVAARLRDHLRQKGVLLADGKFFHVRCGKEILNLMARQGWDKIHNIFEKLKVKWPQTEGFIDEEEWNLVYNRLMWAVGERSSWSYRNSESCDEVVLTVDERKKVEGIFSLIKLIKELADLCTSSFPSKSFHNYWLFQERLCKECTNSDKFVAEAANKMLELFAKYWEDMFNALALMIVMDPQFKMSYLDFFFLKNNGRNMDITLEILRELVTDLYSGYVANQTSVEDSKKAKLPDFFDETKYGSPSGCWLKEYDKAIMQKPNYGSPSDCLLKEYNEVIMQKPNWDFDCYFDKHASIYPYLSCNTLQWWNSHSGYYPTLSRMAQDIFAIGFSICTPGTKNCAIQKKIQDLFFSFMEPNLAKALFCSRWWSKSHLISSFGYEYKCKKEPWNPNCMPSQGSYNFEHDEMHNYDEYRYYATGSALKRCNSAVPDNDRERYNKKVAEMIYRNQLPLHVVGKEIFSAIFEPEFNMITLEGVKHQILATYQKWKRNVKNFLLAENMHIADSHRQLPNLPGSISLAVDICKSAQGLEFLCITGYFIDGDWSFKKLTLAISQISVPLTEDNITEAIMRCIQSWGIGRKVFSITLRNSAIYDAASARIRNLLSENWRLPLDGGIFSVHCCSDMFNQIAKDGLNDICEIVDKVCETVTDEFHEEIQDDKYWNVTYLMLKKALDIKESSSTSDKVCTEVLPVNEWEEVEGMCKLLETLYKAMSVLDTGTANIYFHIIWGVRARLAQESISSNSFIKTMANKMLRKIDKYWEDMFMVMGLALVLDPRFGMKQLEYVLSKSEDTDSLGARVHESFSHLYNDYAPPLTSDMSEPSLEEPYLAEAANTETYKKTDVLLKEYHKFILSRDTKSELNRYLSDCASPKSDSSVLTWWRCNCNRYPTLSMMARDILAVPLSVATYANSSYGYTSSEQETSDFFSDCKELDPYLSSLEPDIMEALICMREWQSKSSLYY